MGILCLGAFAYGLISFRIWSVLSDENLLDHNWEMNKWIAYASLDASGRLYFWSIQFAVKFSAVKNRLRIKNWRQIGVRSHPIRNRGNLLCGPSIEGTRSHNKSTWCASHYLWGSLFLYAHDLLILPLFALCLWLGCDRYLFYIWIYCLLVSAQLNCEVTTKFKIISQIPSPTEDVRDIILIVCRYLFY